MPWTPRDAQRSLTEEDLAIVAAYFGEDGPCQTLVDLMRLYRRSSTDGLATQVKRTLRLLGLPLVHLVRSHTVAYREQVLGALRAYRHHHAGGHTLWPTRTQP